MRLIDIHGQEVSVNYMYLPTFLGLNSAMLKEMEDKIGPLLVGREATEEFLDEANELILDFIEKRFPDVDGLRDYLDALKFVQPKKIS